MRIGIDFDNTIVCYDSVFHKVALEKGLIPESLSAEKDVVRNYLRKAGKEPLWTLMQGEVYGSRMTEADLYPGVFEFIRAARHKGHEIFIISHKTLFPIAGEDHCLHNAAYQFLDKFRFFDPDGLGLPFRNVFFELTKAEKIARIQSQQCDVFVDDLPEILEDKNFPRQARAVLFDPHRKFDKPSESTERLSDWRVAGELITHG